MMEMIVEDLNDIGSVTKEDGTIVGDRPYAITVYQPLVASGGGKTILGVRRVSARIQWQGDEASSFLAADVKLVLTVLDGRDLSFVVGDRQGAITVQKDFKGRHHPQR
jgi:hypothetical protein